MKKRIILSLLLITIFAVPVFSWDTFTWQNIVSKFASGSCSGYLKSDGTCSGGSITGLTTLSTNTLTVTGVANLTGANVMGVIGYNAKSYGLKGDERTVTDAVITAGSNSVSSATGSFTSLDAGKTVTLSAGTAGIQSIKYSSGGTITGAANTTCLLSSFNGDGSNATGVVKLTGTDTIAANSTIIITNQGTGFGGNITEATLTNGTATCSGTATLTNAQLYYQPITTTATYSNSTTLILGANAVNSVTGATMHIGTDDSTAMLALLQTVYDAGGGTIYFPKGTYLINSQLAIPNNGANVPQQPPLTLTGEGGSWDGTLFGYISPPATSALDLRYAGTVAKIDTRGSGSLTIKNLSIEDRGYDSLPFLQTTNTSVFLRDNTWIGSGYGREVSQNDAIVLGGTTAVFDSSEDAAFQGFGSVIERNLFRKVVRGIYGRTYANDTMALNNTWSSDSGGLTAMEISGTVGFATNNTWAYALVEMAHYQNGITLTNSRSNNFFGLQFIDPTYITQSMVKLVGTSTLNSCYGCEFSVGTSGASSVVDAGSNNFHYLTSNGDFYGTNKFNSLVTMLAGLTLTGNLNFATSGVVLGQSGSYGAATYSFVSNSNLGMYRVGSDSLGFTAGGANRMTIDTTATSITGGIIKKSPTANTGGGIRRTLVEATSGALSGATGSIAVNVPSGARIHGIQLRVDTAITSDTGVSWSAAYVNTPTTAICSGQAFAKNTKFDAVHPAYEVATGTVTITVAPNAGNFTAGVIRAVVYYEDLVALSDNP